MLEGTIGFVGSVEYARQSPRHLAALRTVLSRAIWAAYRRSRALGSQVEQGRRDD